MQQEKNYDPRIWLDPNYSLSDVLKISALNRAKNEQNTKGLDCFEEDIAEIPLDCIKQTLCKLKYSDFLRTPYWQMIAYKVKYEKDMVCEMCGKRFNKTQFLDVHHKDYSIHGAEHLHPEALVCLCDFCHKNIHNIA